MQGIFALRVREGTHAVFSGCLHEAMGRLTRIVVGTTSKDPDRPRLPEGGTGMRIEGDGMKRSRLADLPPPPAQLDLKSDAGDVMPAEVCTCCLTVYCR